MLKFSPRLSKKKKKKKGHTHKNQTEALKLICGLNWIMGFKICNVSVVVHKVEIMCQCATKTENTNTAFMKI